MPGNNDAGDDAATHVDSAPTAAASASAATHKPKRVRTGCLTCRERHLKCDEGLPVCQNCTKSSRPCKRGVRLNFIDTQVGSPPQVQPTSDWSVKFLDESREIASEYHGGIEKYGLLSPHEPVDAGIDPNLDPSFATGPPGAPTMTNQPLPPIHGILPDTYDASNEMQVDPHREQHHAHHHSATSDSGYSSATIALPTPSYHQTDMQPQLEEEQREYLNTQEEVLFMQVFVEEVGLWMDSMDPHKHFSRLLPFHSLREPMLLNAFLACGARHLTLVNPAYHEDKALNYYDTATTWLLKSLQNPNRDTVICATTAVILNVYEIMSERPLQRMNHIAGARALIKECGWNARSTGIGAACFWLNVGMELLSCLHFNWQVAWDPDDWGLDMDFSREQENGREEVWTHRIVYIMGKVANFRASAPRASTLSPRDEQARRHKRHEQWTNLKTMAETWNDNIPRTMHPMGYLYPYQTTSKSAFPEVWLLKRTTVIARLFYHTAMCLLAQSHPLQPVEAPEMSEMQKQHATQICGIVAHVKDRGVASVAIRSLAIAAECLTSRREQEEVLQIFEKIGKETGWRVSFVFNELPDKWGWSKDNDGNDSSLQQHAQHPQHHHHTSSSGSSSMMQSSPVTSVHNPSISGGYNLQTPPGSANTTTGMHPPPSSHGQQQQLSTPSNSGGGNGGGQQQVRRRPPAGILNPVLASADFSMPKHPYQNVYVPATATSSTLSSIFNFQ